MVIKRRILFSVLLVALLAVAYFHTLSTQDFPPLDNVASLREYYPIIIGEAQKWHQDAYPYRISLSFEEGDWEIWTAFRSLTAGESESLRLQFYPATGEFRTTIFEPGAEIEHTPEIKENDWSLNSTEAIARFSTYQDVREFYRTTRNGECNALRLEHPNVLNEDVLIWTLSLSDCRLYRKSFHLDALTGERIELRP